MLGTLPHNINSSTRAMLESNLADSERLGLSVENIGGAKVIQFAADRTGTSEAGVLLAKACLGGNAEVSIVDPTSNQIQLPHIAISTLAPLVDCIGCQYAGWPLAVDDFSAMASGPIRLLRGCEPVLEQYGLLHTEQHAVIVLEANKLPTESAVDYIARQAGLSPKAIYICIANTASLPGSLQVVARSVETAMHKLHEIGFDLTSVRTGRGTAPMPPATDNDLIAMGWTNDAILYGANVELTVDTDDETVAAIIDKVPSNSCGEFGKPFLAVFNEVGRDFYKIDPLLFAPAKISIHNQRTGSLFSAGELRNDILQASFGI